MKIKNYILKGVSGLLSVTILASCSTTEKFTIHAKPGTEIFLPDRKYSAYATVPENGKVDVKVTSDAYYGYALAKEPGNSFKVPFGLDYKNSSTAGAHFAMYTGYVITACGLAAAAGGGILAIVGDDDTTETFALVAAGGAGVAALGAGIWAPADARLDQTSYEYAFSYLKNQQAIQDIQLVPLRRQDPFKSELNKPKEKATRARAKASSAQAAETETVTPKGSTAKKRTDFAKNIAGTYHGDGSLLNSGAIEEEYSDVTIVLERVDKNHVKVIFKENGEEYFESPDVYEITRQKRGTYELVVPGLPSAKITISKKGELKYQHDSVILDDVVYTLKATVEKE